MNDINGWEERFKQLSSGFARCACGREHPVPSARVVVSDGALDSLPALLKELGVAKPYLVMDCNTRQAAGNRAMRLLAGAGTAFDFLCLPAEPKPQADTAELARLARAMDPNCDFILGVGSGVLNDLCKMLGLQKNLRTGIVATAPSMDGYASNSSAMILDGVKTTVYNQTPALVLCDLDILKAAPAPMRGAGIGDMAAKAISIAEWRISHLVTGETYCEDIAEMTLSAFREAADHAAEILRGEPRAVRGLTDGLILSGVASSMAQVSRPASGSEHTLSHLMDMFLIARGLPHNLHGAQVGYGVRLTLAAYEALLEANDPIRQANAEFAQPSAKLWERDMRRVFGAQAEPLIADARREGRNTPEALRSRAESAAAHWPEIVCILRGVTAQKEYILAALDEADIPQLREPQRLGISSLDVLDAFIHAKDLRSRYIFPGLVSDLGLMPWMRDRLLPVLGIDREDSRYFDGA